MGQERDTSTERETERTEKPDGTTTQTDTERTTTETDTRRGEDKKPS